MSARLRARSAPVPKLQKEHRGLSREGPPDDGPGGLYPFLRGVHITAWTATHDNSWTTVVCEQPDSTFAVLVAPLGSRDVAAEAVATTAEEGMVAAKEVLLAKSGHECTAECQPWQRERHLFMLFAEDAAW